MSAIVKHTRDAVCGDREWNEVVTWMLQAAGGSRWGGSFLTNDRPVGVACGPGGGVGGGVESVRVHRAGYFELKETHIT